MEFRFVKMNGAIRGFHRLTWWPKWMPDSISPRTNADAKSHLPVSNCELLSYDNDEPRKIRGFPYRVKLVFMPIGLSIDAKQDPFFPRFRAGLSVSGCLYNIW